jgi:serpin B
LFAVVVLAQLAGCGGNGAASGSGGDVVKSALARDTQPAVTPADLSSLVASNTSFSLAFYQAAKGSSPNFFYSPYSLSLAFSMLYAGAAGNTAGQLAKAFDFTLPPQRQHPAFDALDLALLSHSDTGPLPAPGSAPTGFHLSLANGLFGQKGFSFQQPFLDTLAVNYGAGLQTLDFATAPDAATQSINSWVADHTNQRITQILAKGSLPRATRFVLANAVYFLAAWQQPFNAAMTSPAFFQTAAGSTVSASMMHQTNFFGYAEGTDYQAVDLPYQGGAMSMLVLLPKAGQFEAFEKSLDATRLAGIVGGLANTNVELSLPKFKAESAISLPAPLQAMGMTDAFDANRADFSGVDGAKDIFVGVALHDAFVTVGEAGTEAGAATVIGGVGNAMPVNMKTVNVDRPFLFLIRDHGTGAVLFLGRITNPNA